MPEAVATARVVGVVATVVVNNALLLLGLASFSALAIIAELTNDVLFANWEPTVAVTV